MMSEEPKRETDSAIAERRRVQEALEKAQPNYLRDGHGLRGPQQATAARLDGADGWGNSIQVKQPRGGEADGGAAGGAPRLPPLNLRGQFLIDTGGVVSVATIDFYGREV